MDPQPCHSSVLPAPLSHCLHLTLPPKVKPEAGPATLTKPAACQLPDPCPLQRMWGALCPSSTLCICIWVLLLPAHSEAPCLVLSFSPSADPLSHRPAAGLTSLSNSHVTQARPPPPSHPSRNRLCPVLLAQPLPPPFPVGVAFCLPHTACLANPSHWLCCLSLDSSVVLSGWPRVFTAFPSRSKLCHSLLSVVLPLSWVLL